MTDPAVRLKIVAYGSPDYTAAVHLRRRWLREPLGLEFTPAELEQDITATHVLACKDRRVVGCVLGQPLEAAVKIRQMVVTEDCRRTGVGRQLMQAVEAHFFQMGIRHFLLHARAETIGFYESLGYGKVGEMFTEVGLPHQRLDKSLPPDA